MSGPKSLSPHNRFPWEESSFNSPTVRAQHERNQRPRAERGDHFDIFKEDNHHRRTPSFSRDKSHGHQRPSKQEEFHHQRHDRAFCDVRRLSPPRDRDGGGKGGGGFGDESRMFEFRGRSPPPSQLRLPREPLPSTMRHQSHRQQWEAGRREEPGQDYNRLRDPSPGPSPGPGPGPAAWSNVRRMNQPGSYQEKQRIHCRQEKSPPLKRPRRELEGDSHVGFRADDDFEERGRMQDGFKRCHSQEAWRAPPLLIVEHGHGMAHDRLPSRPRPPSGGGGKDPGVDFGQRRSLRHSSQDRVWVPDSRYEHRGGERVNNKHKNNAERLRANSLGPEDHRERNSHFGRGPEEPMEANKNPVWRQQMSSYDDSTDLQGWKEERRSQPFRGDWPGAQRQQRQQQQHQRLQFPGPQGDSVMPQQRMQGWRREEEEEEETGKDMTVASKETLTIKVDMGQPVRSSSPPCYLSERQLSLDLVSVGRQRLDFLPMLEHSGSHRESSARTGTFAQEIITLVHQVREQHFSSKELTLSQRFSAPQEGAAAADMLTLDQRFSSSRGFSINVDSVLDDEEPLFTSGSLQCEARAT